MAATICGPGMTETPSSSTLCAAMGFRMRLHPHVKIVWCGYFPSVYPDCAPWLKRKTKDLIDRFEIVVGSRWPTVQDICAPQWSRVLLRMLSSWRYALHIYNYPFELHLANQFIALRKPKRESL